MPAGSETISLRWVEGAVRECRQCGVKITNLAKQVGEVRTLYGGKGHGTRDLMCMDCCRERGRSVGKRLYER